MPTCVYDRVVKWSSDLRTSNFKLKFVFVFQPFNIQIQVLLIRHRRFCLERGALLLRLRWCTVWQFLCSPPAVNSRNACRVFAYPSPSLSLLHTAAAFNYSSCCTPGACCILMQAIKVTNLGCPDTEQTSIDGNRARHDLTSWMIALLIDCFAVCGVRAVTLISPHSADIKCKLLCFSTNI